MKEILIMKDTKETLKYLLKEAGLASFIFFWAAYSGLDRTREIVADGFGGILMGVGALWLIGAFFRMNLFIPWAISLITALGLVILGFGITEYGVFAGLTFLGIYSIILSIVIIYPINVNLGFKILMIGIIFLICFGLVSSFILMKKEERQEKQIKAAYNIELEIPLK